MEELWGEVEGYKGIYEVSNKGRIRTSKNKTTTSELHGLRTWKQRILKQKTDHNGYKRVSLWKNKVRKDFLVHRLVAFSFLPIVHGKEYVNHIDGNPSNNYLGNLEWCNHKENLIHAYENRLNESPDPIILYNLNTKETHYFYSKATASEFLGRSKGYLSALIKNGESRIDEYEVYCRSN